MKHGNVVIQIEGIGHVIPFKNRKRAVMNRNTGKMRTLTEPSVAQWMDRAVSSIESQLYSACQTTGDVTQQECLKQLRTFLSGLSDDSLREIPEGSWKVERVPKGQEGAVITITQL